MKAKDIMTKKIISVSQGDSVQEAAQKMKQADVGCVAVEDQSQVVGMITDRDIVLRNVAENNTVNTTCKDIMSTNVITVSPDTDINEVSDLMAKRQVKRVPVVEQGRVVGIISLKDLSQTGGYEDDAGDVLNSITETSQQ